MGHPTRQKVLHTDAKGRITLPPEARKHSTAGLFTYKVNSQGVVQLRPIIELVTPKPPRKGGQGLAYQQETIAKITQWASRLKPRPWAVYGFGSFFTEASAEAEDIDLGLLMARPLSQRWEWQQELAKILGKNVDLIDLQRASTVMKSEVIATGERLFCANESACDTFETLAYSSYCLLNEERRGIVQDILKRGNVYG